jgi:hypothetical protein
MKANFFFLMFPSFGYSTLLVMSLPSLFCGEFCFQKLKKSIAYSFLRNCQNLKKNLKICHVFYTLLKQVANILLFFY